MRVEDINITVTSKDGEVLDKLSTIGDGEGQFLLARVEEDETGVMVLLQGCTTFGNLVMIAGNMLESLQGSLAREMMGVKIPLDVVAGALVMHVEANKENVGPRHLNIRDAMSNPGPDMVDKMLRSILRRG